MSSQDNNPAHLDRLQQQQHQQQPASLKYQQPTTTNDPNRDPTLLSTHNPINQPGYQTNQPPTLTQQQYQQHAHHQQPSLATSVPPSAVPNAPLLQHQQAPHPPATTHHLQQQPVLQQALPGAQQTHLQQMPPQQQGHHLTDQQHQQHQQPAQPSLPHKTLPAQEAYHAEKLHKEQQPPQQQVHHQPHVQQQTTQQVHPHLEHQRAVERLPASTLNDPRHPESLPVEYKVAPRPIHDQTNIGHHYQQEHNRAVNVSSNVASGTTTYRNTELPDSGARISPEIKAADRAQKAKFFEVAQALFQGRMPTNAQMDQFLVRVMTSPSLESRQHMLSADGKALFEDLRELLQTLRGVIYEKNEQELFQNLLYHCQSATDTVAAKNPSVAPARDVGVTTKDAKMEAKETLDNFVSVAKLVTTNAEFRSILNELIDLAREIFGEGADKLSAQAMTASEKLSTQAQNASQRIAESTQNNQGRVQQNIQQATDYVQNTIGLARDEDVEGLRATRDDVRHQGNEQYETAKKQASEARANMNKQAQELQGKAKDKAVRLQADAKNYANEKMPPERRRELLERLKIIVGQIQADPQYQSAIESIMNLLGVWRQRAARPTGGLTAEASKITDDPNVNAAAIEFKVLLQRWAQGYPLDPMILLIQKMWHNTLEDPELKKYLDNVSVFMSKVVSEPNYVTSQGVDADAELLLEQGRALMSIKYKADTDALMLESRTFIDKLNTDPRAREMSDRFQTFGKHLLYDKKGRLKFKPHLFDDFRFVWLPSMMESFHFIPVPRIEYADLKLDLVLDQMVLTSTDLIPRLCEISMNNMVRMVPRGRDRRPQDAYKNEFKMIIEGLEANLHNMEYYINTKSGFKFTDRGRADILVGKKGVDVRIHGVKTPREDGDEDGLERQSFITFKDVTVNIHNLDVKVHNSDHKVLFAFAQPFIKTAIKKAISKSIEAQLRELLVRSDKTVARSIRDQRIKTGKNTVGALVDAATSFVTSKVKPDAKTKAAQERKKQRGHYDRTSHVVFDQEGLQVLDPVKHMELKVGKPLLEDPNEMAALSVSAPWVSTAFNMHQRPLADREALPGSRRPRQGSAI